MSAKLVGLALEHFPARSASDLTIALVLADAADHDGRNVYPSVARIAALARASERTVQYAIRDFQVAPAVGGYLVLERQGGGRGNPSRYHIDVEWLLAQPSVLQRPSVKGAAVAPIAETTHGTKSNPAETPHEGCKNGAAAIAPNPPPATRLPTTSGGGAEGDTTGGENADIDHLIDAAVWAAQRTPAGIKNEGGFRARVRQRLACSGPSREDIATLQSWRIAQAKAVAVIDAGHLVGKRFRPAAGGRVWTVERLSDGRYVLATAGASAPLNRQHMDDIQAGVLVEVAKEPAAA